MHIYDIYSVFSEGLFVYQERERERPKVALCSKNDAQQVNTFDIYIFKCFFFVRKRPFNNRSQSSYPVTVSLSVLSRANFDNKLLEF